MTASPNHRLHLAPISVTHLARLRAEHDRGVDILASCDRQTPIDLIDLVRAWNDADALRDQADRLDAALLATTNLLYQEACEHCRAAARHVIGPAEASVRDPGEWVHVLRRGPALRVACEASHLRRMLAAATRA